MATYKEALAAGYDQVEPNWFERLVDPGQSAVRDQTMQKWQNRRTNWGPGASGYGQDTARSIASVPAPAPAANDPYADYMANLKTQQNPFGQNNPQFQSYLQGQMAAYRRNFGGQQQQLAGQLAGRGLMGSGMEAAQRGALAGQQAAGLSNLQTQAMGQQYQQGAEWDKWKQQAMLQGLGGQTQDYLGRGNLALGQSSLALQGELGRGGLGLARSKFQAEREDATNAAMWEGPRAIASAIFGMR